MVSTKPTGKVQTVLGTVDADNLGVTLPHEHIICNLSVYFEEPSSPADKALAHQPVALENLYWVRYHWLNNLDNLQLLDEQTAIDEVLLYKQAGGNTIVDCSLIAIERNPAALARISRATGINIIVGTGYYLQSSMPPEFDTKTEEEIADEIVHDVTVGIGDSGVRAGIIGEIGCSWPWTENERKSMSAAASAQRRTGATITIHPGHNKSAPLEIIELLKSKGADLNRVIFGHIGRTLREFKDLSRVAEAGCYVEFDQFGWEGYNTLMYPDDMPNDAERINRIAELIAGGYVNHILLSHDVCLKARLVHYGGHGYVHILRNVVSRMLEKGISDEDIHTMMVDNPKRVLQL